MVHPKRAEPIKLNTPTYTAIKRIRMRGKESYILKQQKPIKIKHTPTYSNKRRRNENQRSTFDYRTEKPTELNTPIHTEKSRIPTQKNPQNQKHNTQIAIDKNKK